MLQSDHLSVQAFLTNRSTYAKQRKNYIYKKMNFNLVLDQSMTRSNIPFNYLNNPNFKTF